MSHPLQPKPVRLGLARQLFIGPLGPGVQTSDGLLQYHGYIGASFFSTPDTMDTRVATRRHGLTLPPPGP